MAALRIHRATLAEADQAYGLVEEYFAAARVVVREDRTRFERDYFGPNVGFWLATPDSRLAGCIALRELRFRAAVLGEIKRMYVRPAYRGQGIAGALLGTLESYAVRCGYRELVLDTTDEMTSAVRLYEKHGYRPCSRYNENPQATIFMRKEIGGPACSEKVNPQTAGRSRRRLIVVAK